MRERLGELGWIYGFLKGQTTLLRLPHWVVKGDKPRLGTIEKFRSFLLAFATDCPLEPLRANSNYATASYRSQRNHRSQR
jgi:hypothetical protein